MKKKRIIILLIIILGIYLFFRNTPFNDISYNLNRFISKVTNTSEYKTIKQDVNKNYSGIGQEKVKNKNGYFTTFTTIENIKNGIAGFAYDAIHFIFIHKSFDGLSLFKFSIGTPFKLLFFTDITILTLE